MPTHLLLTVLVASSHAYRNDNKTKFVKHGHHRSSAGNHQHHAGDWSSPSIPAQSPNSGFNSSHHHHHHHDHHHDHHHHHHHHHHHDHHYNGFGGQGQQVANRSTAGVGMGGTGSPMYHQQQSPASYHHQGYQHQQGYYAQQQHQQGAQWQPSSWSGSVSPPISTTTRATFDHKDRDQLPCWCISKQVLICSGSERAYDWQLCDDRAQRRTAFEFAVVVLLLPLFDVGECEAARIFGHACGGAASALPGEIQTKIIQYNANALEALFLQGETDDASDKWAVSHLFKTLFTYKNREESSFMKQIETRVVYTWKMGFSGQDELARVAKAHKINFLECFTCNGATTAPFLYKFVPLQDKFYPKLQRPSPMFFPLKEELLVGEEKELNCASLVDGRDIEDGRTCKPQCVSKTFRVKCSAVSQRDGSRYIYPDIHSRFVQLDLAACTKANPDECLSLPRHPRYDWSCAACDSSQTCVSNEGQCCTHIGGGSKARGSRALARVLNPFKLNSTQEHCKC